MKRLMLITLLVGMFIAQGCATWQTGPITGKKYLCNIMNGEKVNFGYWKELRQDYVKKHPNLSEDIKTSILNHRVIIGMTAEHVRYAKLHWFAWGPPEINRTVTMGNVREQWIFRYTSEYACCYLYFDNGILTGWQD